jgi:nucleoside-diphosphate-sugar epimerase
MRVLIVGGTRFIGPHVVRRLLAAEQEVAVFHRGEHRVEFPPGVWDVCDPRAAVPVLEYAPELLRWKPDVVVPMMCMGERDARAAVESWRGRAQRLIVPSSGDVYLAYGRFTRLEPGPPEPQPLPEDAPLRRVLFPYRAQAESTDALEYSYEKIVVERAVMSCPELPATVLRLPKVYGSGGNDDLATVYAFTHQPQWRWTHGYVENVAAAIVLAALDVRAAGRIYNVGEQYTPTVAERLATLPPASATPVVEAQYDFRQDIVYDTSLIRGELGYTEPVSYAEGVRRTLGLS